MPVGQLCHRALDERPVVGRGRRIDIFGERRTEALASAPIGGIVLVVFQRLLTTVDRAVMDCDRTDDIDCAAALRALPALSVTRRIEIKSGIEIVGSS